MNALVTGGAGFIGSNLVRCLVASGDRVRVLDNLSTGSVENLRDANGRLELIVDDIRDARAVQSAVADVDVVYHLAGLPAVARSVEDPITFHAVNVDGTLNVLMATKEAGIRRLVYASSSSVYGETSELPKHEDMPVAPRSPHAVSKLSGELYCGTFARVYGLEAVSLRFFNVFGPRQDPGSEDAAVIPRIMSAMLAGQPPVVFGDGQQSRDFTFVANAVQAIALAAAVGPEVSGHAINIAYGGRTTVLELVTMINELLGTQITPVFASARAGDIQHSVASISKAKRLLEYRPLVAVREGLVQTLQWLTSHQTSVGGVR